jgi:hypothetical protein
MKWAKAELGAAKLGDARLVRRASAMLAALAAHVAGTVVASFFTEAERDAAFKFLSNAAVTVAALAQAIWNACARRCREHACVFVAVDGSSLTLTDAHRTRGTGPIGAQAQKGRGMLVMSAVAITMSGVVLGLCGQTFWTRVERKIKADRARRAFENKESHKWVVVAQQTIEAFREHAKGCVPWFLFDRGGDIGDVLAIAVSEGWKVTVRAMHNRRTQEAETYELLRTKLLRQSELGAYNLKIPAGPRRCGRVARMSVRACTVTLVIKHPWTGKKRSVTLQAVLTQETSPAPQGESRVDWLLLTTAPVSTFAEARQVIDGYAHRWKIELFHNLWKSGRCHVEDSHLHTADRIQKWATLLASVAVRSLRLTQLARTEPETPADVELTRDEIDAILLLRKPTGYQMGDTPPIGLVVRWIAEYGGFTNKSKQTHPGKLVVARGLDLLGPAVGVVQALRNSQQKVPRARRGER